MTNECIFFVLYTTVGVCSFVLVTCVVCEAGFSVSEWSRVRRWLAQCVCDAHKVVVSL